MTQPTPRTLADIARPSGAFAMVAMDQRESLRALFDAAGAGRPPDETLVEFKLAVAATLGPVASGFLIDRHYGLNELREQQLLPAATGLIVAADALEQQDGGPVEDTDLDDAVLRPDFALSGVSALKLLIIWRRDERRAQRVELARRFIAEARARGLLSVLEPVVRATSRELAEGPWDMDAAILEAAAELSPLRPSLYKAQVPLAGKGTPAEQERASRRLSDSIQGPWVVLSQGVEREHFRSAVEAACRAGASGFLAGRALWSDVVGRPDLAVGLAQLSLPRLQRLAETVDATARPWQEAL